MLPHKIFYDMYTWFTKNITSLHALSREFLNAKKVGKILYCLPESWDAMIIMDFQSKCLSTYSIIHLLVSLITYEQKFVQRNLDVGEEKKEKIITFKSNIFYCG